MRSWGLVLVVLFLVAVVAYVLWGTPSGTTGWRSGPTTTDGAADMSVQSHDDPKLGTPADTGSGGRLGAASDSTSAGSAASEPRARAYAGRVVDRNARPIPDAEVVLVDDERPSAIPPAKTDPEEMSRAIRSQSITDANGNFHIVARSASNSRMSVRAIGFAPHARTIPLRAESEIDLGDIVLENGIVIGGRVLDFARAPVAGARVRRLAADAGPAAVLGESKDGVVAVTAADGTFTLSDLAPGPWALLVKSDDRPDKLVRGTVDAGGETLGLEIVLDEGAEIRGRIVEAPQEALSSLWIRAVPETVPVVGQLYAGDHVDPERFVVLPRGAGCAADGSFVVRGLTAGLNYRVSARVGEHDFFGPVRTNQVTARAGARDVQLVYRAETTLAFQVIDAATSQPVTEFEVRFGRALEPLVNDDGSVRRTYPDGRVQITQGLDGSGPLQVVVGARSYAKAHVADVRIAPGRTQDLGSVRLVPAPVIAVRVVDDATGAPVAGARVSLVDGPPIARNLAAKSAVSDWHAGESDADGRVRLNALEGESVRLRVEHTGHAPFRSETAGSFGVARDELVRLQAGGTVVVEVRDALGAAVRGLHILHASGVQDVEAEDEREPDRSRTDAEGRLVFAHLAPGEHAFELEGAREPSLPPASGTDADGRAPGALAPESGSRRVAVADGSTQTLTWIVPPRGRLTGRVTANGLAVSGATLRFTPRSAAEPRDSDFAASLDARTNGNGAYVLPSVELGTYGVTIVHPSRVMPFLTEVAVESLQHVFDVALPSTRVLGRVVDDDGRPVAGARVRIEGHDSAARRVADDERATDAGVPTDADGSYVLHGVQADVDLVVEARHSDYQPARSQIFRVASGESRADVDFRLAAGAVLEVIVLGAGSSCRVRATYAEGQAGDAPPAAVAVVANGTARVERLRPGMWRIELEDCSDPARGTRGEIPAQIVEVALNRENCARFDLR